MKPHLWVGLCVLGLTLATPATAANSPEPATAAVAEKSAVTSSDLTKDQWGDWEESVDDDWVDRRNGDRDRNDRDRFEDDDFFNGVDDERGRDRNDVRDNYGNDRDRNRDRDRDNDDDDDDDYWSGDRNRDEDHRCSSRGCPDDYYNRNDQNWDDNNDNWNDNGDIQFRLQENNNQVLPFILRILQQL